ncbi:hypothetical protein [Plantactinospora soyae]|uniref:Uncharacterized protein n=1 Tax=Plantactinospora soyae TaxID=1544732 RepID=A0A927R0N4_9ACTN|nr:hypothetical protein [Plantactinospora soyae]MBE1488833.1 hypothetical protein [Plantactinospora soyae]
MGVVQDDQHPSPGEQGPEPGGPSGQCGGQGRGVLAERTEEAGEGVGGADRRIGIVAAQVHVEASVREPVGGPVRPVHGERGLAHPGRAGQRRDHRLLDRVAGAEQGVEFRQLPVSRREREHVRRQPAGSRDAADPRPAAGSVLRAARAVEGGAGAGAGAGTRGGPAVRDVLAGRPGVPGRRRPDRRRRTDGVEFPVAGPLPQFGEFGGIAVE